MKNNKVFFLSLNLQQSPLHFHEYFWIPKRAFWVPCFLRKKFFFSFRERNGIVPVLRYQNFKFTFFVAIENIIFFFENLSIFPKFQMKRKKLFYVPKENVLQRVVNFRKLWEISIADTYPCFAYYSLAKPRGVPVLSGI